ncbi:hypothetical protein BCR32DRAFT_290889 [Anaeromyces robustus]|uniref:Uncharacterized protein n=1 Tax=Anaeromyces robustus TaxID=1754192 RepID=A0A1Y1XHA2_9FUNG|nr:hypothetical protein BCR32DRAFT_290889 [Anaeromyces robustus]|eukprot:ORX85117.1 hypothetical protein BCR32DRAFT_290889 [Anaeromyces robustus]
MVDIDVNKFKANKEKRRIIEAIHSTDKKIDFLEKDIINVIGLNPKSTSTTSPSSDHLTAIASFILQQQQQQQQLQLQQSNKKNNRGNHINNFNNNNNGIDLLFNLSVETENNFELFDRVKCNKKIAAESKNLFNKQNQIKQTVIKFKKEVEKKENNLKYLDNLKSLMENIESNIVLFKENQKNIYEELLITEKRLNQELSIFQEHLNDWEEKKSNKDWLVGRNSYTHGLLLKRKNSYSSKTIPTTSIPTTTTTSTSSSSSTPLNSKFSISIPSSITLEAKAILKYGYLEGKKKFESIQALNNNKSSFDLDLEDISQLDMDLEDYDKNENENENENKNKLSSDDIENQIYDDNNDDDDENNTNTNKNKNKNKNTSIKSTYLADVERFRNFYVRNHGRTGGWDELSHSMFEKIWKKIGSNNPRFEQICLDSIPGIDLIYLEKHIQWYKMYQELLQKKKNAIENWRSENKKKRIENQKALNINPNHIELEIKNKLAKEKKRKENEQRQKIKQKLKLWKEKKRLEEEKENYLANEEKKKEKELEEKKLQIKQKINKEKLKAYNEKKNKQINSKNKNDGNHSTTEKRKINLKYFQEKDKEYLNNKLQRKLKYLKEESEKELKLEKIKSVNTFIVKRDPKRILQPTKTFQNYINSIHPSSSSKSSSYFDNVEHVNNFFHPVSEFQQHRAIPLWRRGIS